MYYGSLHSITSAPGTFTLAGGKGMPTSAWVLWPSILPTTLNLTDMKTWGWLYLWQNHVEMMMSIHSLVHRNGTFIGLSPTAGGFRGVSPRPGYYYILYHERNEIVMRNWLFRSVKRKQHLQAGIQGDRITVLLPRIPAYFLCCEAATPTPKPSLAGASSWGLVPWRSEMLTISLWCLPGSKAQ